MKRQMFRASLLTPTVTSLDQLLQLHANNTNREFITDVHLIKDKKFNVLK